MKVIFAGTPEFASCALQALLAAGFEVPLVLTQPDRPAGRGLKLQPSAVKLLALQHGITVAQPRSLRLDGKYPDEATAAQAAIAAAQADVMVVAAYGLILPQWVLDAMAGPAHAVASAGEDAGVLNLGCLNIHASLLPRWRGAAPIHRAIEAGDAQTGITIMQMDAGLDTGDMLLVAPLPIAHDDTTPSLHDKLAALGGASIVQALNQLAQGQVQPVAQPQLPQGATQGSPAAHQLGITYAHKIDKTEARIDWSQSAQALARKVRALDPFPGCTAQLTGETIKLCGVAPQALWLPTAEPGTEPKAQPAATSTIDESSENHSWLSSKNVGPGTIVYIKPDAIGVQCGAGVLPLTHLQRAGGKRLAVADFVRGFALQVGQQFE
jgi:methionyl-tRNA formyltransferase